jgi:hypothetical protein
MENIIIKLSSQGTWNHDQDILIGVTYEHGVSRLLIELPNDLLTGWDYYLEFKKPNGEAYSTTALETLIFGSQSYACFDVIASITDMAGIYLMEFVARKEDLIWKSRAPLRLIINKGINAYQEIGSNPVDFVSQVTNTIQDLIKNVTYDDLMNTLTFQKEDDSEVIITLGGPLVIDGGMFDEIDEMTIDGGTY